MKRLEKKATKDLLPEKLSDLLELSCADAEKILDEDEGVYEFISHKFHIPGCRYHAIESDKNILTMVCQICDAGALMVGTLGANNPRQTLNPSNYDDWGFCRLQAIDFLRSGNIIAAAGQIVRKGEASPKYLRRLRYVTKWSDKKLRQVIGGSRQSMIVFLSPYENNEDKRMHLKYMKELVVRLRKVNL